MDDKITCINKPRFKGKDISLDESLEILQKELENYKDKESLYFRGQGNFAKLKDITSIFFDQYGSTFTHGSLGGGAGAVGVLEGRGASLDISNEQLQKSEVVVIWGKNIDINDTTLMPHIKDKIIVVVDPIKTKLAQNADLFIQIAPRSDIFVIILMARFAYADVMEDESFIENMSEEFDYFVDFIQSFRMKKMMNDIGVDISDVMTMLLLIQDRKTIFIIGSGVQRYAHGHSVVRVIDSFAAMLGFFGKEGYGVSYLGDNGFGFNTSLVSPKKTVPIPTVNFSDFDLIFIQGSNPANQLPCTSKVLKGLKESKFVIYFGMYDNETAKEADLVIPICLSENQNKFSICEYELTGILLEKFGYEKLEDLSEYYEKAQNEEAVQSENIPYSDTFYTDEERFIFVDEIEDHILRGTGFYLVTPKNRYKTPTTHGGNSLAYFNSGIGFNDGQKITINSKYGSFDFIVKIDNDLRDDLILVYSDTHGVNHLTPDKISDEGECAVYQDVRVKAENT